VPGQKRYRILLFGNPVFWAFQDVTFRQVVERMTPLLEFGHLEGAESRRQNA